MSSGTTDGDVEATVAAHDIARLAGVGRAAVSNWRRRFPDFPEPVGGTTASPLYSLSEVEAWLRRHGKRFRVRPGDRVWQRIRAAVDELRLGDLLGHLGAVLLLMRRDPDAWATLAKGDDAALIAGLPAALRAVAPELPTTSATPAGVSDTDWAGLLRHVADAAAQEDPASLYDFLCDRFPQASSRRYTGATPQPLAELMVDLADVSGRSVLDPTCGSGSLLRAAHAAGAVDLRGQEIDTSAAQQAAARLLLHGVPARVVSGDSLLADAFAGDRVDAVLCDPPFSERSWGYDELIGDPRWEYGLPPRSEPELAWLQHCLAHVDPGGRVVIAMPPSAASRRPGRRIRSNLLRAGALRAVISLTGSGSASSALPDVWVLVRPEPNQTPASHVLMVDAGADPSRASAAWQAFCMDPTGGAGAAAGANGEVAWQAVRILDLLDDEVDLSPLRHLASTPAAGSAGEFRPARTNLLATTATLAGSLPDLAPRTDAEPLVMTTVSELARAGVLTIHQASTRTVLDEGELHVLTAADLMAGRAPSGRTSAQPGAITTMAGDVVVPVTPRAPVVRVLASGGAVLGPQVLLFRVDTERLDPYFLAGFLRAAQERGASRGSSSATRTDLRRAPIPRLPLAAQRDYGEAFRRLLVFEDTLRQTVSLGEALVRQGFAGLAEGSLEPEPRHG